MRKRLTLTEKNESFRQQNNTFYKMVSAYQMKSNTKKGMKSTDEKPSSADNIPTQTY